MSGDARRPLSHAAVKAVAAAVLLLVFLNAYWHAAVPGYLRGMDLCAEGCHTTRVLEPSKITHPWWCVGCHGFGVKSEIIPGLNIPLHRDHELELGVERYGECLMCHSVSDRLHQWHMKVDKETGETVKCVDCHTNAYNGGHTDMPGNKVCIRCHDAEATHTGIVNKRLMANCLACHGAKPVVDAAELKKGSTTYDSMSSIGLVLAQEVGPRNATSCLACHNKPRTIGHLKHVGKEIRLAPAISRTVGCLDCHRPSLLHGVEPPLDACTKCHAASKTPFHDKGWETLLGNCYSCHKGFRSNATKLLPAKGCQACHHSSYIDAASAGLHRVHIEAYGNCTVCHSPKAKTHKEFIESVRVDVNKLCRRCHSDAGGLKEEAITGLLKPVKAAGDPRHVVLVEKAKGDCVSCHSEWRLVSKPRVYTFYNTTSPQGES